MGVGKTTTCKELSKKLQNSVWLDGDWCWMIDPFVVNEENKWPVYNVDSMVQHQWKVVVLVTDSGYETLEDYKQKEAIKMGIIK